MWPRRVFILLSCLAAAVSFWLPAQADETPIPVEVAPAGPDLGTEALIASGTLALKLEIPLSFKVGGVIEEFFVDEGDTVKADQILAQLIDTEIDARERSAAANAARADSDLERARVLAERGVISEQALEIAETTAKNARADLDAARFDTRFSRIVATADGVVLRRGAEPGQLVSAGLSVLTIGNVDDGFILNVPLSDRDIVRLGLGDEAKITFAATGARQLDGTVVRMAAQADPATGSFNVEILLQVEPELIPLLRSGMIGSAQILPRKDPGAAKRVTVPADAIVEASGMSADLFVVGEGDTVALRRVSLHKIRPGEVVVETGLKLGEKVVVSGGAYLRNGQSVRIVDRLSDMSDPIELPPKQ